MTEPANEATESSSPYFMSIDLRILNHLGIHLYSNVAAVLSEAVANSWDADAKEVKIKFENGKITISDNGYGMNLQDINERFLNVGYDKRDKEGDLSPKRRKLMGRKGIGKLSLFSVAEVIDVHTVKGTEHNCFRMKVHDIETSITGKDIYRPEVIQPHEERSEQGTTIILTGLKRKRTSRTANALRKRIARRFSIIGYEVSDDKFDVFIDEEKVSPRDREDLQKIEFLWEFGDTAIISGSDCPSLRKRALLDKFVDAKKDWIVSGWIGAVSEPKQLKSDEAGALNNIIVLSRGRLIQEDILDKIQYGRIVTKYLTGQVQADFLDQGDLDDIATSDRQRMIEDDERYEALLTFIKRIVSSIAEQWDKWRNELRGEDAVTENTALAEWVERLPAGQRKPAQRMLGLVRGMDMDEEEQRKVLYKAGILAFERLRLHEASHLLGESTALSAESLLPLLMDLSVLEGSLYLDIVKSRLEVIKKFEGLIDINAKERVLQEHIFNNLWLLDPAWDRATGSERIEERLKTDFEDLFSVELTDEESKGRFDIKYKTNGGLHILVELKKADRKLHLTELLDQGQKYVSALRKILSVVEDNPNPQIQLVFVLGRPVYENENAYLGGRVHVDNTLKTINARVVYFEELIQGAQRGYAEYLAGSEKADLISQLVDKI